MKRFLIPMFILMITIAQATIEFEGEDPVTEAEITRNRACFEELSVNGCPDPGDDLPQFKSCMRNVYSTLSADCRKMMSYLYGTPGK